MTPLDCFICQTKSYFYYQNLKAIKTKHSKRPVTEFIKLLASRLSSSASLIGKSLSLESTAVCYECLDKIDVYDLARSTVIDIENKMHKHLSRFDLVEKPYNETGARYETKSSTTTDTKHQRCSSEISFAEGHVESNNSQESSNGFSFDDNVSNEDDDDEDTDDDIDNTYITETKTKPDPKFLCTICNLDIVEEELFNEHKRLHEGVPNLQCVYCKRELPKMSLVKSHVMQSHLRKMLKIEPYQCEYCGRTFTAKGGLTSHISFVHEETRPIECDLCSLRFKSKNHLRRHMISHTKTKEWECKICLRKFSHRSNMRVHERQHDGETEKMHECSLSGTVFPRKSKLSKHLTKIHNIAPVQTK